MPPKANASNAESKEVLMKGTLDFSLQKLRSKDGINTSNIVEGTRIRKKRECNPINNCEKMQIYKEERERDRSRCKASVNYTPYADDPHHQIECKSKH